MEIANEACGVILCGSAYMKGALYSVGAFVSNVVTALRGKKRAAKLLDKLSFGSYNKPFAKEMPSFGWLSRDKEQVDKYIADEQCGVVMSNAFFKYFLNGVKKVYKKKNLKGIDLSKPVALFAGDKDPVGAQGKLVMKLYQKYKKLGIENVSIKLYPDARHEILNETNKAEVWADFLAKIEEFVAAAK